MKQFLAGAAALLLAQATQAQSVDVNKKTGLVTVDGKDAFYVIKTSKSGFSIQNLEKKEIMFAQSEKVGEHYEPTSRRMVDDYKYRYTFTATGNSALADWPFFSFNHYKLVAATVAQAHVIEGAGINPDAERRFVASHNGNFRQAEQQPVVVQVSTAPAPTAAAANIQLKGNRIYNNDEAIGTFKRSSEAGIEVVQVYNRDDQKVATARHPEGKPDEDWSIVIASDNRNVSVLYNSATPLERLFQYLADKGLVK